MKGGPRLPGPMQPPRPWAAAGLGLAALGYLAAVPLNLGPNGLSPTGWPVAVLVSLACLACAAAAWGLARGQPSLVLAGLGALALFRFASSVRGFTLGNLPFAVPALVLALGLAALVWLAWRDRSQAPLRWGLALAAACTLLIGANLVRIGDPAGAAGAFLTAAGFGIGAWGFISLQSVGGPAALGAR